MSGKHLESSNMHCGVNRARIVHSFLSLLIVSSFLLPGAASPTYAQAKDATAPAAAGVARTPQVYTREGVSVEFSVEPVATGAGTPKAPEAGTEATVRFKITDANRGKPLANLRPLAWLDQSEAGLAPDARTCREKIQSFLQPGLSKRPSIDLNSYFILALNHEPNISVIDPLSGFGGSQLYALVTLSSSGADWVMSADQKRLYVSMPLVNQVAVVDTATWKVSANIDAGVRPTRIALQHDGKYIWVGNDGTAEPDGGVTVLDTDTLKVAARLKTGPGHHEIAFTEDDSLAFVTNRQSGTLSVIDVRKFAALADIKVGTLPSALAFSSLSNSVYVANEGDGTIAAIDISRREVTARMKAQPGLCALRLLPNGHYGFVVNRETNTVYVFDVSSNRLVREVPVGPGADQITFTRQFAYVRAMGHEFVTMINLSNLVAGEADITRFPAGQRAPKESPATSLADAIVPAPEEGAVLVANPADKMIYFYTEGMAAPMGSFQNYRRDPKALLVLDNGLRERAGGVYATTVRLAGPGHYDVAFLLDAPRVVTCFDMTVAENPALPQRPAVSIKVEPLQADAPPRVGEKYTLRFRVLDTTSNQPLAKLEDMGVLVFLAPGIWQQREWARPLGGGVYEMNFEPPQAGVYNVFFQCPSRGVRFNQLPHLTLQAAGK
ncbi:MAG: hypothetical protein QOE46_1616 [Acidobacteriota bacterium]|jgi:YVTN family beta-propeller protein|nr:hypothetical protein [Acidobacteriota bacterium]